jgi:N6-L-threonylcarbamoyladenine synthase
MLALGIESSCDETSVALARDGGGTPEILHLLTASQIDDHRPYGGVVPELATRQHLKTLGPLLEELLSSQGLSGKDLDLVSATQGPGLASSLMVGFSFGKAYAVGLQKPFVGVNHLEGHLLSPFLDSGREWTFPHVALIISGGHTLLLEVTAPFHYRKLGSTRDDAAGEAFDKVAKMLGLAYPGGPQIEREARSGDPSAQAFPRGLLHEDNLDFSFSGLKTAVRVFLQKHPEVPEDPAAKASACASFQQAVIDVLWAKSRKAMKRTGAKLLTVSGGVACNGTLREIFAARAADDGVEALFCPKGLSTDNAGMIAAVGLLRFRHAGATALDADIDPNLKL